MKAILKKILQYLNNYIYTWNNFFSLDKPEVIKEKGQVRLLRIGTKYDRQVKYLMEKYTLPTKEIDGKLFSI